MPSTKTGDLRAVLDAAPDAILVIGHDDTIRYVNERARQLLGSASDIGVTILRDHRFEVGGSTELVLPPDAADARVVEARTTETDLGGTRVRVVVLRDVTERVRTAEALRSTIELRNHIAEVALHQFKGPLTALIGYTSLLRQGGPRLSPNEFVHLIDRVHALSARLVRTARAFIVLTQPEAAAAQARPVATNVRESVEIAVADVEGVLDEPLDVTLSIPPDLEVYADPEHVTEMFYSYVLNAAQHGLPPIEVVAEAIGGSAEILVCDAGSGVAEDAVETLFEEGLRANHEKQRGLGLAIVRRLARLNGGGAWYKREPRGACFVVELPLPSEGERSGLPE